jgi:hypothetical protein
MREELIQMDPEWAEDEDIEDELKSAQDEEVQAAIAAIRNPTSDAFAEAKRTWLVAIGMQSRAG